MVSLGEKTGNLDSALSRASDIFDKEVKETVKRLFAAMEPMIVVLLGAMMLIVLLSIFLPIYGIVGSIRVR
jgi:type II secretory pathway component PulF